MSQDEQDLLLGKACRERNEVEKQIALIDGELNGFSEGLTMLMGNTDLKNRPNFVPSMPSVLVIPSTVSRYADFSKLQDLLENKRTLIRKRDQLAATVKAVIGE
jgi:hypothetical protein